MDTQREAAFLAHIRENERIIFKVCRIYFDDETDRQDLLQEIVAQAWRSYDAFEGRSKFSSWLYRIAINTAITWFRKTKKMRRAIDAYAGMVPATEPATDDKKHQAELLQRAIGWLSDTEKLMVLLYLDDMSYQEMAEILGISSNHVGVKINRIKKKLKDYCLILQKRENGN